MLNAHTYSKKTGWAYEQSVMVSGTEAVNQSLNFNAEQKGSGDFNVPIIGDFVEGKVNVNFDALGISDKIVVSLGGVVVYTSGAEVSGQVSGVIDVSQVTGNNLRVQVSHTSTETTTAWTLNMRIVGVRRLATPGLQKFITRLRPGKNRKK